MHRSIMFSAAFTGCLGELRPDHLVAERSRAQRQLGPSRQRRGDFELPASIPLPRFGHWCSPSPVLPLLDAGLILIWDRQVELLAIAPRGHGSLEDARSDADGF